MINNPDADIRLGDINSPAFRLASAVYPRARVHNFTAAFPGDVDDVIETNFKHIKEHKLILANSLGATTLAKNGLYSIPFFPG